jgi:hypothetical protein
LHHEVGELGDEGALLFGGAAFDPGDLNVGHGSSQWETGMSVGTCLRSTAVRRG